MTYKMETLQTYLNQLIALVPTNSVLKYLVIYCGVLMLSVVINATNQLMTNLRDLWTSTVTTIKNTGLCDLVLNCRVIECCETVGTEEVDCTSMTMIGGSMGKLPAGGMKNVTFLYPNMYLYNRKGECSVEIWFRDPQNRTGSIKANIKFDTYVYRGNVPAHMKEYEHLEDLYSQCSSPDQDPLDGCRPVDCHKKYNGRKNYFEQSKMICVCNPTCYSNPDKELPDVAYLPTCNQCRDLEEPISDQDINVLLRQLNSDLPNKHRCGTDCLGSKGYGNVRCHHGVLDKETGMCACEPGWSSASIPEDLYIPSTLLLHFCTVRSPPSPVLNIRGIGRTVLADIANQEAGTIIFVAGVVSGLLLLAILLLTVKTEKKYRSIYEIRKSRSNSTKPSTSRSSSPPRYSGRHDSVNLERYHSDHQRKSSPDDHQRKSSPDDHQRRSSPDDYERKSSQDDQQRKSRHDDHQRKSSPDDHQRKSSHDDHQRKSSPDDYERKSSQDDQQRKSRHDDHQRKSSPDDHKRKSSHDDHQRKSSHNNDKHAYSTNRDSNKNQAKNTRSFSYRSANYRPESIKSRQSRERIDTTIMTVSTRVSNSDESSGGCCTYPFSVQKQPIGSISSCAFFLNELVYAEFNEVNSMNNSIKEISIKNNNFDSVSSINKHQTRNPSNINQIPLERRSCVKKKTIVTNKKNYWKNCTHVILRRSLDHAVLWKKKSGLLETVKEVIKELKSVQNTNIICKNTTVVPKIQLLDTNIKEHSEYFNQNQQVALNDTTSCRKYGNVSFEVEEYNSDDLEETNDYSIETNLSKCEHTPPAKELTLDYFSIYNNDLTKILPYQIPISKNDNNQHEINEKRDQQCYQLCNELTQKSMIPRNTILNKEPVIMEENTISLCTWTTETVQQKKYNSEQNSSVKSLLLKDESNLKTRNTTLKGTKSFIPVKKSFQKSCDESKQGNVEQSVEKIEKYSLLPKEENFASINMTTVNRPVEVTHLKLDQTIKMHVPFDTKQEINNMQGIHKTAQKVKHSTRINEARKLVAINIGKFMKYATTKENKIIVDDIMNAFCIRPEYEKWIKLFKVNDVETDRNKLRQQYKIIKSFERAIVAVNNFANGKKMKKKVKNSRQRKAEDCLIVFGRSQGELKRYSTLIGNYLDTAEDGLGPLLVEHGPPFDPNAFPTRGLLRLEGDHLQARRLISGLLHHPSGHFSHALLLFGEPELLDGLLEYCGSVARIKYNRELRVHTLPPGSRLYDFVLKNLLNPPINIKKSSITTDIPHLNILWRSTFFFQENEINNHTFTIAMNFLSTISTNKMIKITKEESTDLKRIQNIYQDFLSVQMQKDRLQVPFKMIEILLKNLKTMKRREMIVKLVNTQIKNVNHSLSLSKKQPKMNNVVNQMKRDLDNAVTRYYETFGEFDYC